MYLSDSEIQQLELLKTKKPAERFLLMTQLIDAQFDIMKAGIKYQNPNANKEELKQIFRKRMMEIYSLRKDTLIKLNNLIT